MSLYKTFKTDTSVETQGAWVDYDDGVSIRVARAGGSNKAYLKEVEKAYRKHRRGIDLETIGRDVLRKIMIEVYAKTVILDWKGVTDADGKELVFNQENVKKILTDLPDLFDDLQTMAGKQALFLAAEVEDQTKNS